MPGGENNPRSARAARRNYFRLLAGIDGCKQANPPVTEAQQVSNRITGSGLVVDHHAVAVKLRLVAVEQDDGHALCAGIGEMVAVGDGGGRDDKALHLPLQQRLHRQRSRSRRSSLFVRIVSYPSWWATSQIPRIASAKNGLASGR